MFQLRDGLEDIDGSLYRAWCLEHHPPKGGDSSQSRRRLYWLSYSQDSSLLLDIRNTLELVRVMLARYMGDRKSKPDMALPPGASEPSEQTRSVSTAGKSITEIFGMLKDMWGGQRPHPVVYLFPLIQAPPWCGAFT